MRGRDYAAVLREAAEFFDAHPYLPIPEGTPNLVLYYQHPSPAEIRWLTAIVADEGFKVHSSSGGVDFWEKKLNKATVVLAIPPVSPSRADRSPEMPNDRRRVIYESCL